MTFTSGDRAQWPARYQNRWGLWGDHPRTPSNGGNISEKKRNLRLRTRPSQGQEGS